MSKKNSTRKRLVKIFLAYALVGSALFGTGYGLQTAIDHMQQKSSAPVVEQTMPPKGLPQSNFRR